jgi:hypothetical protein
MNKEEFINKYGYRVWSDVNTGYHAVRDTKTLEKDLKDLLENYILKPILNKDIDPFGEEDWDDEDEDKIPKKSEEKFYLSGGREISKEDYYSALRLMGERKYGVRLF